MRAAERREAILDAAAATFSRLGYRAAGMADIAEASGITQPMLYRHFASKKELYLAVIDRVVEEILDVLGRAPDLLALGPAYARLAAEKPELVRLRLQALTEREDPEIQERFRRLFLAQFEIIRRTTMNDMRAGQIDPGVDPVGLAWLFTSLGMLNDVVVAMELPGALEVVDQAAHQFWAWNYRVQGREPRWDC
ncbi:MAG: TetR/AcrR family transcriptional regulator [Bacillota bacterium]